MPRIVRGPGESLRRGERARGHARTRKDIPTQHEVLEAILAKMLTVPVAELLG
jgi:hypothetical protein